MVVSVLTNDAQLVAVTVAPTETVLSALCPQPESVEPVLQILFTLFAQISYVLYIFKYLYKY